ncbi:hypothetical protein EC973_009665 [Apophysomyces ossiformis]|uniref:Methyltransferase domain-containing protein n=1 Tax=Apophysomyces ossiformis TaxID=679940 RepID=A0A8H7BQR2_9FUNG|nr:hypothetical protein EC973_009665 [Apophysomyces ossiformis]
MGNEQSQPIPNVVTSNLSPKAQRRISQAPYAHSFFDMAAKAHPGHTPVNRPPPPNLHSFFEVAAATPNPHRPRKTQSRKPSASSSTASTSSSSYTRSTHSSTSDRLPTPPISARSTTRAESSTLSPPSVKSHLSGQTMVETTMIEGRRYLAPSVSARYFLPYDDDESDRLIVLHFLLKHAFNGNFRAPIQPILADTRKRAQVLDIGCGPGTWVLELATEFPHADFHGIDLCPMFPTTIKPGNAQFKQHDIAEPLPYPANQFDYIYMRTMLGSMTRSQLIGLLAEITRVLKPGGYIEILDVEYQVQRPGPLSEELVNQKFRQIMKSYDIDLQLCHHLSTLMMTNPASGGFVDIHQGKINIPLGWGGQLGELHSQNIECFLRSLNPMIREAMTRTPPGENDKDNIVDQETASIKSLDDEAIHHIMNECKKYQSHLNWYTCYGQKPRHLNTPQQTPRASVTPSLEEGTWESIHDFAHGFVD